MSALYGNQAVSPIQRYAARPRRRTAARPAIAANRLGAPSRLAGGRTDASARRSGLRAAKTIAVNATANTIVTAAYETGTPSSRSVSGAANTRIAAGSATRVKTTVAATRRA